MYCIVHTCMKLKLHVSAAEFHFKTSVNLSRVRRLSPFFEELKPNG
jgi:hypothetical protein